MDLQIFIWILYHILHLYCQCFYEFLFGICVKVLHSVAGCGIIDMKTFDLFISKKEIFLLLEIISIPTLLVPHAFFAGIGFAVFVHDNGVRKMCSEGFENE